MKNFCVFDRRNDTTPVLLNFNAESAFDVNACLLEDFTEDDRKHFMIFEQPCVTGDVFYYAKDDEHFVIKGFRLGYDGVLLVSYAKITTSYANDVFYMMDYRSLKHMIETGAFVKSDVSVEVIRAKQLVAGSGYQVVDAVVADVHSSDRFKQIDTGDVEFNLALAKLSDSIGNPVVRIDDLTSILTHMMQIAERVVRTQHEKLKSYEKFVDILSRGIDNLNN